MEVDVFLQARMAFAWIGVVFFASIVLFGIALGVIGVMALWRYLNRRDWRKILDASDCD